jgi:hypothetical protein
MCNATLLCGLYIALSNTAIIITCHISSCPTAVHSFSLCVCYGIIYSSDPTVAYFPAHSVFTFPYPLQMWKLMAV